MIKAWIDYFFKEFALTRSSAEARKGFSGWEESAKRYEYRRRVVKGSGVEPLGQIVVSDERCTREVFLKQTSKSPG